MYVDDLTGLPLPPNPCVEARRKELDYFKSKGVWVLRPISEAKKRTWRQAIFPEHGTYAEFRKLKKAEAEKAAPFAK